MAGRKYAGTLGTVRGVTRRTMSTLRRAGTSAGLWALLTASAWAEETQKIFTPSATAGEPVPTTYAPSKGAEMSLGTDLLVILVMLGVLAGVAWWLKQKLSLGGALQKKAKADGLKVLETKMLGNRQFLVVVEYGRQRMLLGVGPGLINHLCFLEGAHDEDDELPPVPPAEPRQGGTPHA